MSVNMHYCRFQNTLAALRECLYTDQLLTSEEDFSSKEEYRAFLALQETCREFYELFNNQVDEYDLGEEELT